MCLRLLCSLLWHRKFFFDRLSLSEFEMSFSVRFVPWLLLWSLCVDCTTGELNSCSTVSFIIFILFYPSWRSQCYPEVADVSE